MTKSHHFLGPGVEFRFLGWEFFEEVLQGPGGADFHRSCAAVAPVYIHLCSVDRHSATVSVQQHTPIITEIDP